MMKGWGGRVGGPRVRRHPARAVVVVALALLAACQEADPKTSVVKWPYGERMYYFGPGPGPGPGGGAVIAGHDTVASVSGPGKEATLTPVLDPETKSEGGRRAFDATADLSGAVWEIAMDGSPATATGEPHALAGEVTAIGTGPPPEGVGRVFRPDTKGVAVVDDETVVVAAGSHPRGYTAVHRDDAMALLVDRTGAHRLAGRPGDGTTARLTDLGVGRSAPGTATSLDVVEDIVPLTTTSVLLLVQRPLPTSDPADANRNLFDVALLDAALLDLRDGRLTRLGLPALCGVDSVGVRVDDHHALVTAHPATGGRCGSTRTVQWVEVDTSKATSRTLGSGIGPAFLRGNRLVSLAEGWLPSYQTTTTVTWALRP